VVVDKEVVTKYPESQMFGRLPAYGLYARHVTGLSIERAEVSTLAPDARPLLVCDDVKNLWLRRVNAAASTDKFPVLWFIGIRNAHVRDCRVPVDANAFLVAEDSEGEVVTDVETTDGIVFMPRGGLMAPHLPLMRRDGPGRVSTRAERMHLSHPYVVVEAHIEVPRGGGRDQGTARARFRLDNAGDYVIWGRAFAQDSESDSFYASIDRGDQSLCDVHKHGAWHWFRVHDRAKGRNTPTIYHLESGEHTLTIRNRESGTGIDVITITRHDLPHD